MTEQNYIDSQWRDRVTGHTYKVIDQTGIMPGVPGNGSVLCLKLHGRRSIFSNPQRFITVTPKALKDEFDPYPNES